MAKDTRQSELIDILHSFLSIYKQPIHYKELTNLLVDNGLWEPYGQQPDQIVYSAMHQDMRRRGEWSAFRLMKGGVFCTSEVQGIELVKAEVPPEAPPKERLVRRKKGDTEADFVKRLELIRSPPTCGNCKLIAFTAAEEYRQSLGQCDGWPESGRHCTTARSEPCHLHQRMTAEQLEARQKRKEELLMLLVERGLVDIPREMYDRIHVYLDKKR